MTGVRRQDKGEMEAARSGRTALDALYGGKSEILDIFLSHSACLVSIALEHAGILVIAADSAGNERNPEPVAGNRVAFGR